MLVEIFRTILNDWEGLDSLICSIVVFDEHLDGVGHREISSNDNPITIVSIREKSFLDLESRVAGRL